MPPEKKYPASLKILLFHPYKFKILKEVTAKQKLFILENIIFHYPNIEMELWIHP